ncbi:MAG: hypothetical protein ABFS38_11950 [Bacteroidota bacterium]
MKSVMNLPKSCNFFLQLIILLVFTVPAQAAEKPKVLPAKAYHIIPETHSDESGYFSLCEGKNGKIYIGTAKYDHNAFLVEFDPKTEKQRIVMDVNEVCGTPDYNGYKSQAKIHTFNYVDANGTIYVGTKQGYMRPERGDDPWDYTAGYILSYNPETDSSRVLGRVPFNGHGVADVMVDEERNIAYVVTCEDTERFGLWYRLDLATGTFRGIGPLVGMYSTTVIDKDGIAYVITNRCKIASYNPETEKTREHNISCNGEIVRYPSHYAYQHLKISPDLKTAWFADMLDARLYELKLQHAAGDIPATDHGRMLSTKESSGENLDLRAGLHVGPDGNIYAAVTRLEDMEGMKEPVSLNHIVSYNPETSQMTDHGVLTIENHNFFDFSKVDMEKYPHHGFQYLPCGALTPKNPLLAFTVAKDGTLYGTTIQVFSLVRLRLELTSF